MTLYIDKTVAKVSPNLYAAATQANLSQSEATQVEQMSYTIDQHRKLSKLDVNTARAQYDKLDSGIQDQLKFMFKSADYMKAPSTAGDSLKGILVGAAKVFASPLIGLFKLGGEYNKLINEPYKVAREVAQGENIFAKKTWTQAWDGNSVYDNGALAKAVDVHGQYDVEVAKGLLSGKTPGEIVQAYGSVDQHILDSIKKAYNEPDKFKPILDDVKYAQVSPGRDIARMLDNKPPSDGGLHGREVNGSVRKVSGAIDFVYQIAIDPLTWLTGGSSKLFGRGDMFVSKGQQMVNSILKEVDAKVPLEHAVENAFKDPQLFNLWENQLGPLLKDYKAGNAAQKGEAYRKIAENHPGWANPTFVKGLADGDVVDVASAKKYFESAINLKQLISGRVDGMTYMRNGVAVARTNRLAMDGLVRSLDGFFNFRRPAEEVNKLMTEGGITEALVSSENALSRLKSGDAGMGAVRAATESIKGWKRIGHLASRSAAGLEVRVGEKAALTAGNFTARARQILPLDMAEALTQTFLSVPADEQIVILRNVDAAAMWSMGLGGEANGEKLIMKTLAEKYGDLSGFATKVEKPIALVHVNAVPDSAKHVTEIGHATTETGPIHPYQSTWSVGSLPYDEIGSMVWNIKSKKNIINAIGGATQGHNAKRMTDAWSIMTLLPRLGIRSAIDEATMYALTAPSADLLKLVMRYGNKMGNISKAFSGSTAATGPIKAGIQKLFKIKPDNGIIEKISKKLQINPEEALSAQARVDAVEAYAKKHGVDSVMLDSLQKREAVSEHVAKLYAGYIDEEDLGLLFQAFKHSPDALNSMAQSLVAHSALSGKFGQEVLEQIITPTMLDAAMEEIGVKMAKGKRQLMTIDMSQREVTLAHYEKWYKMLAGNKASIVKNGKDVVYLNPADIFFEHDALRTEKDLTKALDDGMKAVGFEYSKFTNSWRVRHPELVQAYKELSSNSQELLADGLSEADSARHRLYLMFRDMHETFHGDVNAFNETLLAKMIKNREEMQDVAKAAGYDNATWNQAAAKMSLHDFEKATDGFKIKGTINTAIDFGNFDAEQVFKRYGNQAMEAMDKQVTGLFRQPAVMITYIKLRKKYTGLENAFAKQQYDNRVGLWESSKSATGAPHNEYIWAECKALAEKRFTEISLRDAADIVLKYADNPTIRSNAAFAGRTVGRYYRATEDFYRRIYRMKDVSPQVLYRMRLSHLGLNAAGMAHVDQNGEPYIMMPMDNIIFKATDSVIRTLTFNRGYAQPLFNEFTFKLRMMNPSFSQDSGLPTLSGPIAGLGVIAVKDMLGTLPGKIPFIGGMIDPVAKQIAEGVDTFALGNIGDNMDITRAIVPAGLQRMYAMLPIHEKDRQEVTAAQQAIAYNSAHGLFVNAKSTDQEKSDYLNNVRISAHNVLFLRNFLGLMGPVAPTMMETKGVPDYLKDTGITGLRAEFFDILNGITSVNTGDVFDPYEAALATFTGTHPGKLVYTVSRDSRQTKVLVKNTQELKSWGIQNEKMIQTYGEAAYIFAPKVGKFNAATYNWIKAAGLVSSKSLEQYYNDLLVAQDKQSYYDIARHEKQMLSTMSDPELRAQVINQATDARASLKSSNPLLTPALIGHGNNIGGEEVMMKSVEEMINNQNININPATRLRMQTAIKMMQAFIAFCKDPAMSNVTNSVELKAQRRQQIEADLTQLMTGDAYVTEANRSIFKSILNFYSRDSYQSFKGLK